MKHDEKDGVTIENILRLKRLERPPVEFWAEFEKELRAKQLSAIVQKRVWWKDAMQALAGLARYHVPIGASAALALAFFTVREYRSSSVALVPVIHARAAIAPVSVTPSHDDVAVSEAKVATVETKASVAAAPVETHAVAPMSASTSTPMVPLLVGSLASDSQMSPSARSIDINLAAARAAQPEVARRLMGPVEAFEARMMPTKAIAMNDPIAHLDPAAEERRARLLGTALPGSAVPAFASDKLASRLSDDRLYEQISRYSAVGDRLSLKF